MRAIDLCNLDGSQPTQTLVGAAGFWDLFFGERLKTLDRDHSGYAGIYKAPLPGGLLYELFQFRIKLEDLSEYDTTRDLRFKYVFRPTPSEAIASIISAPGLNVADSSNWRQLRLAAQLVNFKCNDESLDYDEYRRLVFSAVSQTPIAMSEMISLLSTIEPSPEDARAERSLLLKALALLPPPPGIARSLLRVLDNPFENRNTVLIAIWTLGRINDPDSIGELIARFSIERLYDFATPIERTLQYMLSGPRLIPLSYRDEAAYWHEAMIELAGNDAAAREVSSVFWQKRLRAVHLREHLTAAHIAALSNDEVLAVRNAARSRWHYR